MKKIVTHINPDLDAVCSVWLIKRFLPASPRGEPGWEKAEIIFHPIGETIDGQPADSNPDILYVDTGLGSLDHHQTGEYLSAAKLCFDYLKIKRRGEKLNSLDEQALSEIVDVVTQVDNARELEWQEVNAPRFDFYLHNLIKGIRGLAGSDQEAMDYGLEGMDAVFNNVKNRIRAEEEIKKGIKFKTPWGKALALESGNQEVTWEGEKRGYCLVARKDPETGAVRIYARYDKRVDLTDAYNKLKKMDPKSDWFLHATKKILLNESRCKDMRPTKLRLEQIIEILKKL